MPPPVSHVFLVKNGALYCNLLNPHVRSSSTSGAWASVGSEAVVIVKILHLDLRLVGSVLLGLTNMNPCV